MLAAVNPCGFPLLPAYLEFFVGRRQEADSIASRSLRAVTAAALATVGFLILFGILGTVTQVGWSQVTDRSYSAARYVMIVVGVAMVILGALYASGHPLRLKLPQVAPGIGRRRRPVALILFGLSYGIASIGCALPLFVSGVAASFDRTSTIGGIAGFAAYGIGMGCVLCALSLGLSILGTGTSKILRRLSRWIPVVGGALLMLTGIYIAWYWINDLVEPTRTFILERWVLSFQERVSSTLDAHASLAGVIFGVVVVAALLVGGMRSGISRPAKSPEAQPRPPAPSRQPEGV